MESIQNQTLVLAFEETGRGYRKNTRNPQVHQIFSTGNEVPVPRDGSAEYASINSRAREAVGRQSNLLGQILSGGSFKQRKTYALGTQPSTCKSMMSRGSLNAIRTPGDLCNNTVTKFDLKKVYSTLEQKTSQVEKRQTRNGSNKIMSYLG